MFMLAALLSGCRSGPSARYVTGALLLQDTFDAPYGWDSRSAPEAEIGVRDGAYRMNTSVSSFVRGMNNRRHTDVVIEVEVIQLSAGARNAFGVICRGSPNDNNANGYYFLIGGDGTYSIRRGRGGEVEAQVAWARSGAIRRGTATNRVTVVCIGDYLALYVNGQFLAETRDSRYASGYAGFTVATTPGMITEVAFDALTIWEGALVEG